MDEQLEQRFLLKVLVPAGLTEFVGYFGYVVGVGVGLVSIVVPICSASPAVTVVLAHTFLKEGLLQIQKAAIVLIILGVVLLPILSGL